MEKYTEIEHEISHVQKQLATVSGSDSLSTKSDDIDDVDDYIAALQAKETNSRKSVPKLKVENFYCNNTGVKKRDLNNREQRTLKIIWI